MDKNYCLKCMRKLGDSPVCKHCGFDNSAPGNNEPYHLKPGSILAGKYLIGNVIGEGGFGITYIGLQTTLSKRVAIKEYYPSGAANRSVTDSDSIIVTRGRNEFYQKGLRRFLFEAQNVAAFCEEDGIVDIMDYFQENNTAYIVMEYLEGETLKDYVARNGVFKPETLISLMIPLMQSLNSMHANGIIHRDISPDNIMYHRHQRLKLMDFGSARYFTNEERQMSVVLKQGFAPEEQYRSNGEQGPYTDVYALCATIYTCITGKVPVSSVDRLTGEVLKKPSELGVKIAPYQENALMHGLAVKAADRTPTITALIKELTTDTGSPYGYTAATNQAPIRNAEPPHKGKTIQQQPIADSPRPTAHQNTTAPQNTGNIPSQTFGQQNGAAPFNPQTGAPNAFDQRTSAPNTFDQRTSAPNTYNQPTGVRNSFNPQTGVQNTFNQNAANYNSYNPNSYNPNSYNPNSFNSQPPQPPKKSPVPKILAIVIPAIVIIAAVIIVVIVLNSNGGSGSDKGSSSKQETSQQSHESSESSKDYSSTNSLPVISFDFSSDDSSSSQSSSGSSSTDSGSYITPTQASQYKTEVKDYFFNNIFEYDDKVSDGDQIRHLGIWYLEKHNGSFNIIYYLYHNETAGYYRTVSIFPTSLQVSDGKLVELNNSFDADEAGKTEDEARKNSYFLSSSAETFYDYTEIFP